MKKSVKLIVPFIFMIILFGCSAEERTERETVKVNHFVYQDGGTFENVDQSKNIQEEISPELALKLAREYLNTNVGLKIVENSQLFIREDTTHGYYLVEQELQEEGVLATSCVVAISKTDGEILCCWMI